MKTWKSIIGCLLLFVGGCSTTSQVKLVGLIQSSKTDENDNPVDIYLWDGKVNYPISPNGKQGELLEKVDSRVEAQAELTETWGGEKSLLIKAYRVLVSAGE